MSDADDQMGGTGGETGPPPKRAGGPADQASEGAGRSGGEEGTGADGGGEDPVTEQSKESFPASDPPSNY